MASSHVLSDELPEWYDALELRRSNRLGWEIQPAMRHLPVIPKHMRKEKRPQKRKKQALEGYKKIGSTFVPPIVHRVGPLSYVSWSTQIMPELVWWDVIIDQTSERFAAKVAEEIGKHFRAEEKRGRWWAFISDYAHLSPDAMDSLQEHLKRADVLTPMMESLIEFVNLYPECPISRFLEHRPTGIVDLRYLDHFESRINDLEDRHSRNGVLIQAQAVYMGFVSGKLMVKPGLILADHFLEVQHYPATERSKQVGAGVCAMVTGLAGRTLPKYPQDAWAQYFWRRSLELRPLDFSCLENHASR